MQWGEQREYARAAYEQCLLGELLGQARVFLQARGEQGLGGEWVGLPFREAIELFLRRRVMSRKAFDRLSASMKSKAFTIAGDHSDYTRAEVKISLGQALEQGWSKERWIEHTEDLFDRVGVTGLGRHHLETVFETNVFASYQHGRLVQQRDPVVLKMRPYWRYRTVGDSRVRDAHRAMDGFTAAADDPVWKRWYPPSGFRCRCRVDAISRAEAEKGTIAEPGSAPPAEPDEGFDGSPIGWLPKAKAARKPRGGRRR